MIKTKSQNHATLDGALVVILNDKDEALIMLRPNWVKWAPAKWAYPGGKLEVGETPLQAAVREVKEETSLDVTNLKPLVLPSMKRVVSYYTRDYTGDVTLDWENEDWAWASRASLDSYDVAPDVVAMYEWVLAND